MTTNQNSHRRCKLCNNDILYDISENTINSISVINEWYCDLCPPPVPKLVRQIGCIKMQVVKNITDNSNHSRHRLPRELDYHLPL
jgi:hypothetical protein